MNKDYKPNDIEPKWQEVWEKERIYSPDIEHAQRPFYNLMMFPYPSAEGLHVGNMYAFTGADVYGRFQRMKGYDVLEPIGLDGFGIHSENYAMKVGRHPKEQAQIAEKNFYRQLRSIGNSFDWSRTVETYDPEYYKWTQWLFIQLFKKGLAYRDSALVNWCPKDLTVLSDEQVVDGCCERCGEKVEKRNLEQWFFRITNYAERLLNNIEGLQWTNKVKIAQKNWIGKSEGAEVEFKIQNSDVKTSAEKLKFSDNLIGKVLSGEKTKTYRLTAKAIKQGDYLGFVKTSTGEEFAAARITNVEEKKFGDIAIDEAGHESYKTRDEMHAKYREYYPGLEVSDETTVWVYSFELAIDKLTVFTTRPDTLYGATFMVIAPEHPLAQSIERNQEVSEYIKQAKNKTEIERTVEGREKTGVFSGLYAINPVNNEKIPVWIADYVLAGYGTGAIMAVPAHDQRDFEFAKKYSLPITPVISNEDEGSRNDSLEEAYIGAGKLINSGEWDGIEVPKEMGKVLDSLESKGTGARKANYHLRDWLISRQRYWGPPIPLIFCSACKENGKAEVEGMDGWFSVPEAQLPVKLPEVEDWKPMGTGKSPLANHPEFYKTVCPNCSGEATRETDVSDTFLDSAWYFLRYVTTDWEDMPFSSTKFAQEMLSQVQNDQEKIENWKLKIENSAKRAVWLPVNQYIGGAEHSVLHLLYSRFVTMALHDMGHLSFEEPFSNFYANGLIIKDGAKMSKSKGNVVVPDEYVAKYGADTLRTYLMFIAPLGDGGDFRDSGIEGMHKFLKRVWNLLQKSISNSQFTISNEIPNDEITDLDRIMHKTIKDVTEDIQSFRYNTAIARLMEYNNALSDFYTRYQILDTKYCRTFLLLLAPLAPHMTEEIWQQLSVTASEARQSQEIASSETPRNDNSFNSIHLAPWPKWDSSMLERETADIVVQINGKKRLVIELKAHEVGDQEKLEQMARDQLSKYLEGQNIVKVIYVEGKILNLVVK